MKNIDELSGREEKGMSDQTRFIVRETKKELEKLDRALETLGYFNRADWYREKKRELIEKAAERENQKEI